MKMKIDENLLKIKEAKFLSRFNGYSISPKSRYFFVIRKDLNEAEFFLFCLIWDVLADWDSRHLTFGAFEINFDLLAYLLNWSVSKLRRVFKNLLNKGYLVQLSDNCYSVVGFELKKKFTKKSNEFNFYSEYKKMINNFENKNVENNQK